MKLVSLNVNGIRAAYKKGVMDFLKAEDADIIMLQEVKATRDQLEFDMPEGYSVFWNPAFRAGYSGTALLSRERPIECVRGIPGFDGNEEGRVICCEFADFYAVCVYTPNSTNDRSRLDHRGEWDAACREYLASRDEAKPVIVAGDFNAAHEEIDLKNPESNHMSAGFTDKEREGFSKLLGAGFADTFRRLYPDRAEYSWFSYRTFAKKRNVGWRIDYFLVSERIFGRVEDSLILGENDFSDHVPIELVLK